MSARRRVVLGVAVAIGAAAWFLVGECADGGGMGAPYQTCRCLGVEWELYDRRPADGPHRTLCVGVVSARTCYRITDRPVVECP